MAFGLLALAVLVAADLLLGTETSLAGTFAVAPFVAAVVGTAVAVAVVGGLAVAAAIVVPLADGDAGSTAYYSRVGVLILSVAFALFAARALERNRRSTARLELLDAIGAIATGALPLDETLRLATHRIAPAVADICMIDAVSERGLVRVAVGVAHPDPEPLERVLRERKPSIPERFTQRRTRGSRPEPWLVSPFTDDDLRALAHDPGDLEFLRSLGVRSALTVPLVARGTSLGALTMVTAWSGRLYDGDDVRFAETLAGRVALALDNAGLFSSLESVERRMDNVMQILDEAVIINDAAGELVYANPAAARTVGFDSAEELLERSPAAIMERFEIRAEDGTPLALEDLVSRRVLRGEPAEPLLVRSINRATGAERWLQTKAKPIEGPDGTVLYSVTAIEDVTEVKTAEFGQRLLARTGELMGASLDYRRTLQRLAAVTVPEFADCCTIELAGDGELLERVALAHRDPERTAMVTELRGPVALEEPGAVSRAIRSGEARLFDVTPAALREMARDEEHLELLRRLDLRSVIVVPMAVGAKTLGGMVFANERSSRSFTSDDLELALEIARRAAIAVENGRLANERAEVARVLQRGLLPPAVPAMPGWELATMYRPAGEVSEVGGDFYDAFAVEGGWMVVIGDVVGRGPAAASLTALARYTIRTAGMMGADPDLALGLLNDALRARDEISPCTVAIIVLPHASTPAAEVRVACAGHPQPLLVRGDAVAEVGAPGPLLGAFEVAGWRVEHVRVEPRDQLIAFTDGVTEARGGRERFGERRLHAVLAGTTSPVHAIALTEAALDGFAHGDPDDDAAMVAIRRAGGAVPRGAAAAAAATW